jgi:hypothetical protein
MDLQNTAVLRGPAGKVVVLRLATQSEISKAAGTFRAIVDSRTIWRYYGVDSVNTVESGACA